MIYPFRELGDGAVSGTVNGETHNPKDPSKRGLGVVVAEAGGSGSDISVAIQGKATPTQSAWATLATIELNTSEAKATTVVLLPIMRAVFTATSAANGVAAWLQD